MKKLFNSMLVLVLLLSLVPAYAESQESILESYVQQAEEEYVQKETRETEDLTQPNPLTDEGQPNLSPILTSAQLEQLVQVKGVKLKPIAGTSNQFQMDIHLINQSGLPIEQLTSNLEQNNTEGSSVKLEPILGIYPAVSLAGGEETVASYGLTFASTAQKLAEQFVLHISYGASPILENGSAADFVMCEKQHIINLNIDIPKITIPINITADMGDLGSLLPTDLSQYTTDYSALTSGSTGYDLSSLSSSSYAASSYPNVTSLTGISSDFPVTSSNPNVVNKPKLIISKYQFDPQFPKAGNNFIMSLSFYNTNAEKSIRNIKISLTADAAASSFQTTGISNESVFSPVNSSNTFFIDSIDSQGTVEKTITLFVSPTALAKIYNMTANFDYEDYDGNQYTTKEIIGIPVIQKAEMQLGELSMDPILSTDEKNPVSITFYNTGKDTLSNLMVSISGNFKTNTPRYFVGNFTSGSTETFDTEIIPQESGPVNGVIRFTYEDSTGQKYTMEQVLEAEAQDIALNRDKTTMGVSKDTADSNGSSTAGKIAGLVLAGAVIASGYVYDRKKKQKVDDKDLTIHE